MVVMCDGINWMNGSHSNPLCSILVFYIIYVYHRLTPQTRLADSPQRILWEDSPIHDIGDYVQIHWNHHRK